MTVSRETFDFVRHLVEEHSGTTLDENKSYLVDSRLLPMAKESGVDSVDAFIRRMRSHSDMASQRRVVETMMTHETSFFRDPHYYETLSDRILPELIARRQLERRLSIWCAACASGQEAYSMAMLLHDRFPGLLDSWDIQLIATDFSRQMIERASAGTFREVEIRRGLNERQLSLHFQQIGRDWQISHQLRQMVQFREHNLMNELRLAAPLDLILLRNALIYMVDEARIQILQQIKTQLRPDGYLVLGASETVFDLDTAFESVTAGMARYYRISATR